MPPPRAISCPLCGHGFFQASLPFHLKSCEQKTANLLVPCPYCRYETKQGELQLHMSICKKKPKLAPSSVSFPRVVLASHTSNKLEGNGTTKKMNEEWAAEAGISEGRMACTVCGRRFALNRIGVHSAICHRLAQKSGARRRGVYDSQKHRLPEELKSYAVQFGRKKMATCSGRRSLGGISLQPASVSKSERTYTNWRERRAELRAGLRAARQYNAGNEKMSGHSSCQHTNSSYGHASSATTLRLGSHRASTGMASGRVGCEPRKNVRRPRSPPNWDSTPGVGNTGQGKREPWDSTSGEGNVGKRETSRGGGGAEAIEAGRGQVYTSKPLSSRCMGKGSAGGDAFDVLPRAARSLPLSLVTAGGSGCHGAGAGAKRGGGSRSRCGPSAL